MKPKAGRLLCTTIMALSACATPQLGAPPSAPTFSRTTERPAQGTLMADYERSIRSAAVRDPSFEVDLRTISPKKLQVTVATFTEWGTPASPTQRLIWVSLPGQLRSLCHDKPDSVLALQEALGLPPQPVPMNPQHRWQVITFTVPRSALFRPCPGGTDIAAPRCANTLAKEMTEPTERTDTLDAATTRFLLDQLWNSNRIGFSKPAGAPDWGYPFTGMGWAYNWDPTAASPVGVSEFVVRDDTVISNPVAATPSQFCNNRDDR
jgi:hypothetical protein